MGTLDTRGFRAGSLASEEVGGVTCASAETGASRRKRVAGWVDHKRECTMQQMQQVHVLHVAYPVRRWAVSIGWDVACVLADTWS